MTTGPIDWGAHDPDLVERVLAVMLLQERPRAWRRERSKGDAGVDVADVVKGGFEVLQIKSFTGSLTSRRKTDIENSFKSALAGGALDGPIMRWRLLLPMDPSKEAEKWFKSLTKGAPFECEWWGKSRVDLLAATHPHVVDYYMRDGRSRIEQRYRDLLRMRDLIESSDVGPRPSEISEGLRLLLEALNRDDPHYRYAFEVSPDRPPIEGEQARPRLVMAMTECQADRGCVTIRVFARHRHAVEERPITISFGVEPGSDAYLQLQRAFDFGSTAELPDGSVINLAVSAPAGLDRTADLAGMRVSGYDEAGFLPFRMTFAVLDEARVELARTAVAVVARRSGVRGKELACVEAGGAFKLEIQIANPSVDDLTVSMSSWELDFWGKSAVSVRAGVNLLSRLCKPNTLVVSLEAGERHLMTLKLDDDDTILPPGVASFVRDLSAIQRHTPTPLLVPLTITAGDARRAREAAQLVAGVLIDGEWEDAKIVVDAHHIDDFLGRLESDGPFAAKVPYRLRLGTQNVDLGAYLLRLASAGVANADAARAAAKSATSPGAGVSVDLVPGADARFEMLWVNDRSAAH